MIFKTIIIIVVGFVALVVLIPLLLSAVGIDIISGGRGAAGAATLLRSADRGERWEPAVFVRERRDPAPVYIYDVAAHPTATTTLFAGTKAAGLWKSDDSGATWKQIKDAAGVLHPRSDVYRIVISRSRPQVMYAAVYQERRGRVMRSDDGGISFREIYFTGRERYGVFDLFTPPAEPDTVLAATGEGRLLVSNDGGKRWRFAKVFRDPIAVLAMHPRYPNEGYLLTSRGRVFTTYDGGVSWTDPGPSARGAGTQEGDKRVIEHPYSRLAFFPSRAVRGFTEDTLAPDPYYPGTVYRTSRRGILKSSDGGGTWAPLSTFIDELGAAAGGVAVHPAEPDTVMVTAGQALYTSRDRGIRWSIVPFMNQLPLKEIYIHPYRPDIIFIVARR